MGKLTITPDDRQRLEAELKGNLPSPDSQAFEDLLTNLDVSNPDLALEIRNAVRLVGLPSALEVQGAKAKEDAQIAQFIKKLFYKETPDGPVQDKGKITRTALALIAVAFSVGAVGAVLKPAKSSSLSIASLAGTGSPTPVSAELPNGSKPSSTGDGQAGTQAWSALNSGTKTQNQNGAAKNGTKTPDSISSNTNAFPGPNTGKSGVKNANSNPKTVNYDVTPGSSMTSPANDGTETTAQSNASYSPQTLRSSNAGTYSQPSPYSSNNSGSFSSGQSTRYTTNAVKTRPTTSTIRTKPTAVKTKPKITAPSSVKRKNSSLVGFATTKAQSGASGLKTGNAASTNRPSSGGFSLGTSGSTKPSQSNPTGLRIGSSNQAPKQGQANSVVVNSSAPNRPTTSPSTVGTVNVSGSRQAVQAPPASGISVNNTGNRQTPQTPQNNVNINNASSAQTAQGSPQTGLMVSSASSQPRPGSSTRQATQTAKGSSLSVGSGVGAAPPTSANASSNPNGASIGLGGGKNSSNPNPANLNNQSGSSNNAPPNAIDGFPGGSSVSSSAAQSNQTTLPGTSNLPPLESIMPSVSIGVRLEAKLVITVVAVEQGSSPVVAVTNDPPCGKEKCSPIIWIGQALLGPDRRIWVSFTQATVDGKAYSVSGQALERTELRPGLPAQISDEAPAFVSDILRGTIGAFGDFLGAQLGAKTTTTIPGGGAQQSSSVPDLENFFLGRLSGLFGIPADTKALVRVARVPVDSTFTVLYGIPINLGR